MNKQEEKVLELIYHQTPKFLESYDLISAPTTGFIAKKMGFDRSVVSKLLNQLYKAQKLIKINTRPVIYLALNEKISFGNTYSSIAEFKDSYQNNIWENVIGANGSLKDVIEQLKAALVYPPSGLPAIIFGESGTGKTFLIKKLFAYAKAQEIVKPNAQLVVINCAQYANNPELLSSALFGYVKGSFTGADFDKKGALAAANNGILFLDEVHRLSPEGQEKLFTYLDTGRFSPVGSDTAKYQSKTRLFFATTEDEKDFLGTFLRRIPIKIKLPPLDERGAYEKRILTHSLLIDQAKRINSVIKISKRCLSLISHCHFDANVGELKNLLQNIVAKKYALNPKQQVVEIKIGDLPSKMLKQIRSNNFSLIQDGHKLIFRPTDNYLASDYSNQAEFISKMEFSWHNLLEMQRHNVKNRNSYYQIVQQETHAILYSTHNSERSLIADYIDIIASIFNVAQIDCLNLRNLSIYDLAIYIYYLMRNESTTDFIKEKDLSLIATLYNSELRIISKVAPLVEMHFEISLKKSDCLWLAILISNDNLSVLPRIPAILVAHGYATASSMADTCNHFLQNALFTPVDLKPDVSREEMIRYLKDLIKKINPQEGLVILMDMGALESIIEPIKNESKCDLLVINNVSMSLLLEIGNQLLLKKDLQTIQKHLPQNTIQSKLCIPQMKKLATVITTCMTGMGSAQRIKNILSHSFLGLVNVQVEACDFKELVNCRNSNLLTDKNAVAIIGIDNPDVAGIPYFGLEEIMTGEKIEALEQVLKPYSSANNLKKWEKQLIKNFSLDRILDSLTIISPTKVMNVIGKYLQEIQLGLNQKLSNRVQISLYVHIANMIERIIRGNEIKEYNGDNSTIVRDHCFSVLKKYNSVLEGRFSIKVNDPETAYIRDLIVHH